MSKFPALMLWTDAYLGDTNHLTTIEHGAYLLLLMTAWRSKDCTLPNDDKMLARYTRMSTKQWGRVKPIIMEFFTIEGDRVFQSRLTAEYTRVRQKSANLSNNAKGKPLRIKDSTQADAEPIDNKTAANGGGTTSISTTTKNNPPTPLEWGDFVNCYPDRGKLEKDLSKAEEIFIELVGSGVDPAEIIDGLKGYASAVSGMENKRSVLKATTFLRKKTWKEYLKAKLEPLTANGVSGEGWEEVLKSWSDPLTSATWLYPLVFEGVVDGVVVLIADSEFTRSRCEKFQDELLTRWKSVNPEVTEIKIVAMQERAS